MDQSLCRSSWAVLTAVMWCAGCGNEPETAPPDTNRAYSTPDQRYVGHLKPQEGPPLDAMGNLIVPADPVVWVVDRGEVRKPEYARDAQAFRLDFDESKPLTEDVLPHALMTQETKQVVIYRGKPPEPFAHPAINDSEPCVAVFQCANPECPRVSKIDNLAIFPVSPADKSSSCPFCGNTNVERFYTPQYHDIQRFLERSR